MHVGLRYGVRGDFVSGGPNNALLKRPVAYQTAPATTATSCNQLVPTPCLTDERESRFGAAVVAPKTTVFLANGESIEPDSASAPAVRAGLRYGVRGEFVSGEPNNVLVKRPVACQTAPATTATSCNQLVSVPRLTDD